MGGVALCSVNSDKRLSQGAIQAFSPGSGCSSGTGRESRNGTGEAKAIKKYVRVSEGWMVFSLKTTSGLIYLRGEEKVYSYVEKGGKCLQLIELGKWNFKDQGCDVRSIGRSSWSMRQGVAFDVGDLL
ncbi:hypothetical protein M569_00176 [Genlisea aurea]|uniref:Uncharacterized protein n=1 Tax=Genlisea aurea TaxID=192259 RepID=S8ENW6_9LAMI|nr:hypothetical protein M569_00176 [Genlisea aurea]